MLVEGGRISRLVPADDPALPECHAGRSPGRTAAARLHRHAGQWRGRRTVQQRTHAGRDSRDRPGSSQVRHDGFPADLDQRRPPRARARRRCGPGGARRRRARRARHPHRRAVHQRRAQGSARPSQVPPAGRNGLSTAHFAAWRADPGHARSGNDHTADHPRVSPRRASSSAQATPTRRYAVIRTALDHGLRGFTHLFNAMSQLTAREPGVVGAALTDAASWCGIIVDGRHVDPVVLRLALRCKPLERFMLVTDAMANVGTDDTSFELQGRSIRVDQNAYVDEFGTLAGSHMDMSTSVRNTIEMLGVALPDAVRMASASPAEFLGLSDELGVHRRGSARELRARGRCTHGARDLDRRALRRIDALSQTARRHHVVSAVDLSTGSYRRRCGAVIDRPCRRPGSPTSGCCAAVRSARR